MKAALKCKAWIRAHLPAALGLKKGDIITGVNRDEVKDIASLKKSLSSAKGNISALRISRDDSVIYITIR